MREIFAPLEHARIRCGPREVLRGASLQRTASFLLAIEQNKHRISANFV